MKRDTWGKPDPKKVKNLLEKADKKSQMQKKIDELDEVFSIFIRKQNIDENGMTRCFTCSKFDHWTKLQCGHFFSRRYYATRWEEKNCAPQCVGCNMYNQGNGAAFAANLIKKHHPGILDELSILKNRTMKVDLFTIEVLIKHYKSLIK